jgi:hypothetical protein
VAAVSSVGSSPISSIDIRSVDVYSGENMDSVDAIEKGTHSIDANEKDEHSALKGIGHAAHRNVETHGFLLPTHYGRTRSGISMKSKSGMIKSFSSGDGLAYISANEKSFDIDGGASAGANARDIHGTADAGSNAETSANTDSTNVNADIHHTKQSTRVNGCGNANKSFSPLFTKRRKSTSIYEQSLHVDEIQRSPLSKSASPSKRLMSQTAAFLGRGLNLLTGNLLASKRAGNKLTGNNLLSKMTFSRGRSVTNTPVSKFEVGEALSESPVKSKVKSRADRFFPFGSDQKEKSDAELESRRKGVEGGMNLDPIYLGNAIYLEKDSFTKICTCMRSFFVF